MTCVLRLRSAVVLCGVLAAAINAPTRGSEPVRVALRPQSRVAAPIVTFSDVADLSGGDPDLRRRIGRLDVATATQSGDREQLTRDRLEIRLLLAGIGPSDFELAGASQATVTRSVANFDAAAILSTVGELVAAQLQVDPEDLELSLAQPLPDNLIPADALSEQIRLEPRLPTTLRPGRIQLTLQVFVEDRLVRSLPLSCDVAVYREVAKTTRLVARGDTFSASNVASQRVRMSGPQSVVSLDDVLGRQALRSVGSGALLQLSDVSRARQESEILIRPRDVVRIVARKGKLTVALTAAVALETGREGDMIRVRNPSSGRIITGRVVGRHELELAL